MVAADRPITPPPQMTIDPMSVPSPESQHARIPAGAGPSDIVRMAGPRARRTLGPGIVMTAPVTPSERDVCALAGMVSEQRDDLPAQGLPMSLLSELKEQIPCDVISFEGFDSDRQLTWFAECIPGRVGTAGGPVRARALEALLGLPAVQLPRPHR